MLSSFFQGVQPQGVGPIGRIVLGVDVTIQVVVQRPDIVRVLTDDPPVAGSKYRARMK